MYVLLRAIPRFAVKFSGVWLKFLIYFLVMNVLYLSQDFLGINFEMAFQRTDYEFVCYVLLRTYLHCTAFRHYCMV